LTNTIVSQPTDVSLQTTDYFLTWQGSQSPGTRKTPVSALGVYYATLASANTFTGKITVTSGGATITGTTNVVGSFSASGSVGGASGAFSGAVTGATATFSSTVKGATGVFSGGVSTTAGTFSSSISATSASFSGAVSMATTLGVGVAPFAGSGVGISNVGTILLAPPSPTAGFVWTEYQAGTSIQGSVTYTGSGASFNTTSDETLKLIDGPLTDTGHLIDALEPIWYRWKSNPDTPAEPGFGAQTTHAVFPWAVTPGDGERPWQMDQAKLMSVAIAEIKALRKRVEILEAREGIWRHP